MFQPLYLYGDYNGKDCEQWFMDRILRLGTPVAMSSGSAAHNLGARFCAPAVWLLLANTDVPARWFMSVAMHRPVNWSVMQCHHGQDFQPSICRDRPVPLPAPGLQLVSVTNVSDAAKCLAAVPGNQAAVKQHFNLTSDRAITHSGKLLRGHRHICTCHGSWVYMRGVTQCAPACCVSHACGVLRHVLDAERLESLRVQASSRRLLRQPARRPRLFCMIPKQSTWRRAKASTGGATGRLAVWQLPTLQSHDAQMIMFAAHPEKRDMYHQASQAAGAIVAGPTTSSLQLTRRSTYWAGTRSTTS